jgi:hypothetical protein
VVRHPTYKYVAATWRSCTGPDTLFDTPLTIKPISTTAFSRGAVAHVFAAHP